jgi:hypothetical protein
MAVAPGGVTPSTGYEMYFGDPFATDDTVDQVEARYGGGMDGAHHLARRNGEENAVEMPIYASGYQLFQNLCAAGIGTDLQAASTYTGTDVEMRADVGSFHYLTSPSDLLHGANSTFGAFGFSNAANNRLFYSAEGSRVSAVSLTSTTISFEATGNEIVGASGEFAGALAGDWLAITGSASNNWTVLVDAYGASALSVTDTDIAFVDATNRITKVGAGLTAAAGDWLDISGSGTNDGRGRVLSVVDANTLEIDPATLDLNEEVAGASVTISGLDWLTINATSATIVDEAVGASVTLAPLYSIALAAADMNGAPVDEAAGQSVTLDGAKQAAGTAVPLFSAVTQDPPEITTDPFLLYERVYVGELSYANDGESNLAFNASMGSAGSGDPLATNPFTTVLAETFTADDEGTKPATTAHRAGAYGDGESIFFGGDSVCFTSINWTLGRPVAGVWCAEEVGKLSEDAEKPTFEITDATVYQLDGDTWRLDQREKRTEHYRQVWTSENFRNGVSGSAALVLDVYNLTLTSAGDVATGVDAEPKEHP